MFSKQFIFLVNNINMKRAIYIFTKNIHFSKQYTFVVNYIHLLNHVYFSKQFTFFLNIYLSHMYFQ